MANPFANIQDTPYVSFRTALPLDQLRNTGEVLQGRWEANKSAADILENSMSNVLTSVHDKDRVAVEAFNQEVSKTLDAYAKRGDYHNLSKELSKLSNQYAIRVKPALEERAAIEKDIEEIRKRTDMTEADKARWIEDINRGYTGVVYDKDMIPIRKTYTSGTYASSVDPTAIATEYVKKWNPDSWGISEKQVRDSLKPVIYNNPQVVAYKQSLMNASRRKYDEMVRSGKITQEQANQQLAADEQAYNKDILDKAIELGVQSTAFTKLDDNATNKNSKDNNTLPSIFNIGTTQGRLIPTTNIKSLEETKKTAQQSLATNPDDADLRYKVRSIDSTITRVFDQTLEDGGEDALMETYNKYAEKEGVTAFGKPRKILSYDEYKAKVKDAFIEAPTGKTRVGQFIDQAVKGEISSYRREDQYITDGVQAISKAAKSTLEKGVLSEEDYYVTADPKTTVTGKINDRVTQDFKTTISNFEAVDEDQQLSTLLGSKEFKERNPSLDMVTISGRTKNGKPIAILHTFAGTEDNPVTLRTIAISPKNASFYGDNVLMAAAEMIQKGTPSVVQEGYRWYDNYMSKPIVDGTKFREYDQGYIADWTVTPNNPDEGRLVFKRESDGTYGIYVKQGASPDASLTPYIGPDGNPVTFVNENDFARKLTQIKVASQPSNNSTNE